MVGAVAKDRRWRRAAQHGVPVGAAGRGVSGVEVASDLIGADDSNLFWQVRVERMRYARHRQAVFNLEVRDLPERVDTGICTAGTDNVDLLAGDSSDRTLNLALNGAAAALPCARWCRGKALPARESRAVVLDDQLYIASSLCQSENGIANTIDAATVRTRPTASLAAKRSSFMRVRFSPPR